MAFRLKKQDSDIGMAIQKYAERSRQLPSKILMAWLLNNPPANGFKVTKEIILRHTP